MSNPRTRSKAQAGAPASATMQPVGLVVPSTHSRSSSYDNVNAWREKQAAFPASSAGSPDEDCMPPNDDGSVSGSAVTPASSVILQRNSANGDVESVSNDGNKPKRIPTTPHRTSPIFQTHATELTVLASLAHILSQSHSIPPNFVHYTSRTNRSARPHSRDGDQPFPRCGKAS
jgi:hypothetical protein